MNCLLFAFPQDLADSFCSRVDDDDLMTLFIGYEDGNDSDRGDISNQGVRANKLLQLCKSYHICPISTNSSGR